MCSNTSSGGAADSAGDLGDWTPGSYNQLKGPKIPRRGPGVAELEKILREQEKKECATTAENANLDGHFSRFVSSLPDPYHHSQSLINSLPRPPPPPITTTMHPATPTICSSPSRHVCLVPNLAQFSPPPPDPPLMTSVHGNDSSNAIIGRGGGVFVVGGATVALPEKALFAITWAASSKSSVDGVEGSNSDSGIPLPTHIANESIPMSPSPKLLQRRHGQDPSVTVNRNFPGSATPSSSDVSPAKPYNHIEHPSNQRSSYNYTSLSPQQVQVHVMTRPKPFSEDKAAGPQLHFQVPRVIDPRISTPDQSSSWYSHSASNVGPSNKLVFRGARGDGPSDINSKKLSTTYNNLPDNNLYRFGCLANHPPAPMAHSLHEREFSKLDKLATQESEDSDQRSGMGGSDSEKSFHDFFQPKEQMGWKEFTLSSNDEKGNEEGDDDIDLNLKL
ncbi:hypothetical protein I3760_09G066100 [Carya illinoinensis]|nr:hypothetical protein I3760_09G066100 [Carya illinoinensis]